MAIGVTNDMWEFNLITGQWSWVNGANTTDQLGTYGTVGNPSTGIIPVARFGSARLTDASGNYWLFGGHGLATNLVVSNLNDLFKFNPVTSEWT